MTRTEYFFSGYFDRNYKSSWRVCVVTISSEGTLQRQFSSISSFSFGTTICSSWWIGRNHEIPINSNSVLFQTDLTVYKNDADRMYTVFDEQEFVEFMLKRDIHRDNTEKPIAVMIGDEWSMMFNVWIKIWWCLVSLTHSSKNEADFQIFFM